MQPLSNYDELVIVENDHVFQHRWFLVIRCMCLEVGLLGMNGGWMGGMAGVRGGLGIVFGVAWVYGILEGLLYYYWEGMYLLSQIIYALISILLYYIQLNFDIFQKKLKKTIKQYEIQFHLTILSTSSSYLSYSFILSLSLNLKNL